MPNIILPVLFAMMLTICVSAQNRIFSFNKVQSRNSVQQWQPSQKIGDRTACFSEKSIDFNIDKFYHLQIVKTTHLPNKGIVYLCRDEQMHEVTVMLIADEKMYLYSDEQRFLISFSAPVIHQSFYKAYASAD